MGWLNWFLLGDLGQQLEIHQVREQMERMRSESDLAKWDQGQIKELASELLELELRHALLVRLLISKGLLSAEEYASLIASARNQAPQEASGQGADEGWDR